MDKEQLHTGCLHGAMTLAVFFIGMAVMFGLTRCGHEEPKPIVLHDTISVHDTLRITKHTKPKEVIRHDTIWLEKVDSAEYAHTTMDAEYALVPITQSEYRDTFATDSTRAEVAVLFSGYSARIDSVGINYQTTIQPVVYEKESGFGWSVTVGPYVGWGITIINGQVLAGPEVGFGLQLGIGYQKKFKSLKRR